MQRVFLEDVKNADGKIIYPQGAVRDWPLDTWYMIASSAHPKLARDKALAKISKKTTELKDLIDNRRAA